MLRSLKGSLALCGFVCGLLAGLTPGGTARAETFKLSIGAGHPAGAAIWVGMIRDYFVPETSRRVAERTGHRLEWSQHYGGTVCKPGECLEAVEAGLLDVADIQTAFEPAKLIAHNFMYFVPFGMPDPVKGAALARQVYDSTPELGEVLEKRYKQVFLANGIIGNYGVLTSFVWDALEQLKGRKIAAAGPNIPWMSAVGPVPVQSNLNEAYTAFQTGVYEGWLTFPEAVTGFKLHEVTKSYTLADLGVNATPLITINRGAWQRLPPAIQEILLEVGRDYTIAEAQAVADREHSSLETMRKAGLTVRALSEEEKARWAKAMPNLPRLKMKEIADAGQPAAAVETYIRLLKEAGLAMPRDWLAE